MLLRSLTHLIENEICSKGGKKSSRSRIDFDKMGAKHAAFVDICFCPYLLTQKTIHTDEGVEAVGENNMVA